MSDKKKTSKKKDSEKDMMAEIKKMEAEKRAKAMEKQPKKNKEDEEISFDTWWMRRSKMIPQAHRKEIIKADFKGRGMKDKAKTSDFDKALEKYGLKLNK